MKIKQSIKRYISFIAGILSISLGARIFLLADLGTAGIDATGVGLSEKIGLSTGVWIYIIEVILVVIATFLNKEKINFKPLLSSVIFAVSFDLWGHFVFEDIDTPKKTLVKVVLFSLAMLIETMGTAFYLLADVTVNALDYFMLSIKKRFHRSLAFSRILTETLLVLAAFLVGGPIGIGTILIMIFYGPILQFFHKVFKRFLGSLFE